MRCLTALILLTACAIAPPPPPPADICGAAAFTRLNGQPATALQRELVLRMVRVIRPGDAVTMDFQPARINFIINDAEMITDIRCG